MINIDDATGENIKKHNRHWSQMHDHPQRIRGSESRKKNALLNLIHHQEKVLSQSEIEKYEYLPDEEMLPSNRKRIIEKAKLIYSPLAEALKKTIKDQGKNK